MGKKEKSIELAFLLRHDKDYQFDIHGWRSVKDLVENHHFTEALLADIVATDNKGRYEYNEDHTMLRARQGHSIDVDVELEEATPPDTLLHGTATRFYNSIKKSGIKSMGRNYVQLSEDISIATMVGSRHGKPIILYINTKQMKEDGIKFYLSRNNVWLTKFVDPKYIKTSKTV